MNILGKKNSLIIVYLLVGLALFVYSIPTFTFFILSGIIFLKTENKSAVFGLLILSLIFSIVGLSFNGSSRLLFDYYQDDFVTYYNNFYCMYSSDNGCFKAFGVSEPGLPVINFIFSLIVWNPYPRAVLFLHSVVQLSLIMSFFYFSQRSNKDGISGFVLLCAAVLVFYKSGSQLLHLRQGYSSIFIVGALLFSSYRKKYGFLFFAFLFHNTAIIIYPICSFILYGSNRRRNIASACLVCLIPFIYLLVSYMSDFIFRVPLLANRLAFLVNNSTQDSSLLSSLVNSINRILYVLPLFFSSLYLYYFRKNQQANSYLSMSLLLIVCFVVSSYLPSFQRVFAPIAYILMGFIYYSHFKEFYSNNTLRLLLIFLWVLTCLKWFMDPIYFYSAIPKYDYYPFYYLDYYSETSGYIDRSRLPYRMQGF